MSKDRQSQGKKAQTNVVWADTNIGVNKENAVIKKAGKTTSLTAC